MFWKGLDLVHNHYGASDPMELPADLEARLAGWRNLVTAQVDDTVGPWAWRARSWASHRDERVEDPADELGLVGGAQHDTSDEESDEESEAERPPPKANKSNK